MRPMSDERAIENAIVSTQMEGFEVTESDRKLLMKIIKKTDIYSQPPLINHKLKIKTI